MGPNVLVVVFVIRVTSLGQRVLPVKNSAEQDKTGSKKYALYAIDGAVSSCSEARHNSTMNAWWRMELKEASFVTRLAFSQASQRMNNLANINIFVSLRKSDETNETICATFLNAAKPGTGLILACKKPLFGKFVTIMKRDHTMLEICEIEAYGTKVLGHVLPNESTSQSGTYLDGYPDFAVDGDIETCSYAGKGLSSKQRAWWRVKLHRSYFILGVLIRWNANKISSNLKNNLNVYTSMDERHPEQNLCATHSERRSSDVGFVNATCRQPTHGIFVKVERLSGVEANELVLCEVYVLVRGRWDNITPFIATMQNGLIRDSAGLAMDGDIDTCTRIVAKKNENARWTVKLNDTYGIGGVRIFHRANSSGALTLSMLYIYTSNTPNNLEKTLCVILRHVESEKQSGYLPLKCSKVTPGDIVTIKRNGGSNPRMLDLCEVEVLVNRIAKALKSIPSASTACQSYQHKCEEGLCIHRDFLCDGTKDCPLGDDETAEPCLSCPDSKFKCFKNNKCIEKKNYCDGTANCPDSSDEQGCLKLRSANSESFLRASFRGESDYYICSTKWQNEISLYACNHLGFKLYQSFSYVNVGTENILKLKNNVHFVRDAPFMSLLEKSQTCQSNRFVKLSCHDQPECGKRGLADTHLGPYMKSGAVAIHGAWPWLAQLVQFGDIRCGASIIQRNALLTAARCVKGVTDLSNIHIEVGTVLRNDPQAEKYQVSQIIIHPRFRNQRPEHDVAIIKLKRLIHFGRYVQPVCLPQKILTMKQIKSYRYCVSTGFGRPEENGNSPRFLVQGRVDVASKEDCVKLQKNYVMTPEMASHMLSNYTFCIGPIPSRHGISMCPEDSGGPMVCRDENGKWTQLGIIEGGLIAKDGEKCIYSVITSVAHFLDFIQTHV